MFDAEIDEESEPDCLEGVHLMFDSEAADLLPMVIRYFTHPFYYHQFLSWFKDSAFCNRY